jgi:hypothetical protein
MTGKLRKLHQELLDVFKDMVTIDEEGKSHQVPAIWATKEKIIQTVETEGKIKLPVITLTNDIISVRDARFDLDTGVQTWYDLNIITLFEEDANQILEQVIFKFDNTGNCKLHALTKVRPEEGSKLQVLRWEASISVDGIEGPIKTKA